MHDIYLKLQTSNKDHIGQTEEYHVTNQLSKFQLNPTINKLRNIILPKLRKPKKRSPTIKEYEKQHFQYVQTLKNFTKTKLPITHPKILIIILSSTQLHNLYRFLKQKE